MQTLDTDTFIYLIRTNPDIALREMYDNYYALLCNQIFMILKDRDAAEDIVQDVFYSIWCNRDKISINQSFELYLRKACRNRTLNYIRDYHKRWEDDSILEEVFDTELNSDELLTMGELNTLIHEQISRLPKKCGVIFSLSRFEEMSYQDIADSLNISVKTVENQISKALRILREKIYKN